jgi:peroxiredoxin
LSIAHIQLAQLLQVSDKTTLKIPQSFLAGGSYINTISFGGLDLRLQIINYFLSIRTNLCKLSLQIFSTVTKVIALS